MNYKKGKKLLDTEEYLQALDTFKQGAATGDLKCIYGIIAAKACMGEDFSEHLDALKDAFPILLDAADENDADACFIIARCFEKGLCTEASLDKAIEYYSRASALGNSDSLFNLGCINLYRGFDIDVVATECFLPSAQLENASAQFALGHYFEHKNDTQSALLWYSRAAQHGAPNMKEKLKSFLSSISR